MELGGWKRRSGESLEEFFKRIAAEVKEKPPWTKEQQVCWSKFMTDLNKKSGGKEKQRILERAYSKYYHDFESAETLPKVELAADLKGAGYLDMLNKLMKGDYAF